MSHSNSTSDSPVTADTFRDLIRQWRVLTRRRSVAWGQRVAAGCDDVVGDRMNATQEARDEAYSRLDCGVMALEEELIDLTVQTVGVAPASIRVDRYLVAVGTNSVDDDESRERGLAIVDLGRATVLA